MISVIVRGTYKRDSNMQRIKIGRHSIICSRPDMRYLNSLEVGEELTCLCLMESGELYYRFSYIGTDTSIFTASGILESVSVSKNPKYLLVKLIQEHVAPEGDRFATSEEDIYIENTKEQLKKLRKIRFGDAVSAIGIVVVNDNGKYFCVAKEIKTLNSFVVLTGLEHSLPFDDKRRDLEGLEVKKEDF